MTQDLVLYALILGVVLATVIVVAVIITTRKRTKTCTVCGTKLPRRAQYCPGCRRPLFQASSDVPGKESPKPQASSVELVAVQGPLAQQHFPIPSQGLTIGRHTDNDIVLAGELMVSRQHAVIAREQGQYVLYDRDSANGTWVNEQRIFRRVLAPGDRIQIWQSQFVFALPGAPLPSPIPPASVSPPAIHVEGELFAGYYLQELIGRGGMSEVFKAQDPNGQTVAVKILQQTDPYLVNKFMQEGNKIGPLLRDHPNIVYVHEFGQGPDNRLYIVMEFVDAPSLRRIVQQSPGEPKVVSIMGQVCNALAFAHQHDVVHRDIKPENILVTAGGKAMVLDFGIAKLTSAATVTRDKIVGTPEYISPEQARGEPVRPASDVYSLGIVLYELLTGSVPFRRPRVDDPLKAAMEVIRQHLKERPEPLRQRDPNVQVSKKLEKVTMRALKKDIKGRYATAKEMGRALGYEESVQPVTAAEMPALTCLVILQGARRGQRIQLTNGAVPLGRLDLDPADTGISRQHANVIFRGGAHWLQDTSKNGTWVDNQRVYGEVPLRTGSVIMIGDNVLRLETRRE